MKRKIVISILFVILFVIGHFYYSMYSRQYTTTYPVSFKQAVSHQNALKIGTYNIKSLNYNKENLEHFNEDIQDLKLDVICLQEVDHLSYRSGHIDMLKQMAKDNGFQYYHFYTSMWIVSGYYGLGILSKYPIKETSSKLLTNSLFKEPRILTKTTILVNHQEIKIYNTHLTYENNEIRKKQMKEVKDSISFQSHTILAGDFNSFFMNQDFKIKGVDSINQNHTYPTFSDFGYPDDLFYSQDFIVEDQGVKKTSFSDHHILYAKFKIN